MSATREHGARIRPGNLGDGLRRGVAASRRSRRSHPKLTIVALLAGLAVILGCGWLWFRDSSFVSVSRVRIVGLSGPHVPQIQGVLRDAALTMTTLDVNMAELRHAVSPYADVRSLSVDTQFPHGLVIRVDEQVPIAQISTSNGTFAVSRSGLLLRDTSADARLPMLPVGPVSGGGRLRQADELAALSVLAVAPYGFLGHVQAVRQTSHYGLVVFVRRGPQLRFGPATQLHDKWAAALAVLGNASSQGAAYIDVTDPGRPAAGAPTRGATGGSSSTSSATSSQTSSTSSTTTTPSAGTTPTTYTAPATTAPTAPTGTG